MRRQEGRNQSKIKSHNWWVGDSQTGKHLYRRSAPTGVKVLSPTSDFPTWGSGNERRNSYTEFEAYWKLIAGQDWGKQRPTLGGCTQNSVCIGTQGKEQ